MGTTLSSTLNFLPPPQDFFPPTPEAYVTLLNIFQFFPLVRLLAPQKITSTNTTQVHNYPMAHLLAWRGENFLQEFILQYSRTNCLVRHGDSRAYQPALHSLPPPSQT